MRCDRDDAARLDGVLGGSGSVPGAPSKVCPRRRPPEERFAVQLEQLQVSG